MRVRSWRVVDADMPAALLGEFAFAASGQCIVSQRGEHAWFAITGRDAVAVGPSGSHVGFDQGRSWQRFDDGSFDTVDCASPRACWASGTQGRVAYLVRTG